MTKYENLDEANAKIEELEGIIISSKKKEDKTGGGKEGEGTSQEDIKKLVDEQVKARLEKEKFYSQYPDLDQTQIDKIEEKKALGLSYEEAGKIVLDSDTIYQSRQSTNGSSVGDLGDNKNGSINKKVSAEDYNSMSPGQKVAYEEFCTKTFGGFTLETQSES